MDDNTRHNGGSNTCYVDGHPKWLNARTIMQQGAGCDSSLFAWR